ncbi:MAG TPA: sugar ABC transporter ATP-binding protein [Terriglobales bacterium]|jgi:putative xylitol transport system ATP-binding protein|nr:sugar ABC transporter ATP-binding protein [Terriglobales bacterium]
MTALLKAESIRKSYGGVPVLHDGRIELQAGSVHALCGGNGAGKSTFLNILMGLESPDGGRIWLNGSEVRISSSAAALAAGISIITQELSPLLDMTVAENLYVGREPRRGGWFVDRRGMEERAAALLERLNFQVDPRVKMRKLSLGQIQLVEIAKAIDQNSSILIMDEPTSAIGEKETAVLFDAIARLKAQGAGIIYVSHRLSELFSIADEYTVFRDGRFTQTGQIKDIDRDELIRLIVGRSLVNHQRSVADAAKPTVLDVKGFSRAGEFEDIDLSIKSGEILGLYGLMGAGRSEFASALYGISRRDRGSISIDGRPVGIGSPRDALDHGMAMITEDRKATGLILMQGIRNNISLTSLPAVSRWSFVDQRKENAVADRMIARFEIKLRDRDQPVRQLSGGNQQKVLFARSLTTAPKILICDEPTRGVDEGAKREIHVFLSEFAAQGNAVLMISSEIPEILAGCDRVVVFRRGRRVAEAPAAQTTPEQLLHWAS